MARTDDDYLQELTVQLRLAGLDGRAVGAILEEARDHLDASGQSAAEAFGPAQVYAAALVREHDPSGTTNAMRLTRGELLTSAAQLAGWLLFLPGLVGLVRGDAVVILPGHLAGLALLTGALMWPMWPVLHAYISGRIGIAAPILVMMSAVAGFVALSIVWDSPELATLAPWIALLVGAAVLAACWLHTRRLRDPIHRPTLGEERSRPT